ncbi:MAG: hypothetical protein AAF652_13220 [Cyanobacteria bacterium P01_C01_bin.72]
MGKYSGIVNSKKRSDPADSQSAKERAPIESGLPSDGGKPENQKTVKVENNKAGNQQSIKTREPENQKVIQEDMVNLSIKVPRRLRQKWVAESRLRGSTLTAIISDYLKAELGE